MELHCTYTVTNLEMYLSASCAAGHEVIRNTALTRNKNKRWNIFTPNLSQREIPNAAAVVWIGQSLWWNMYGQIIAHPPGNKDYRTFFFTEIYFSLHATLQEAPQLLIMKTVGCSIPYPRRLFVILNSLPARRSNKRQAATSLNLPYAHIAKMEQGSHENRGHFVGTGNPIPMATVNRYTKEIIAIIPERQIAGQRALITVLEADNFAT